MIRERLKKELHILWGLLTRRKGTDGSKASSSHIDGQATETTNDGVRPSWSEDREFLRTAARGADFVRHLESLDQRKLTEADYRFADLMTVNEKREKDATWTPVPAFPGYEISPAGLVRDKYNQRVLKTSADGTVTMQIGTHRSVRSVAKLLRGAYPDGAG